MVLLSDVLVRGPDVGQHVGAAQTEELLGIGNVHGIVSLWGPKVAMRKNHFLAIARFSPAKRTGMLRMADRFHSLARSGKSSQGTR